MAGLVLSLSANERFLVNGAMLANGPKRSQICIQDNDVHVLRISDVIAPTEATTPVKKVYYLIQLILSCDQSPDSLQELILSGLDELDIVFENTPAKVLLEKCRHTFEKSRYYSALCALKLVIEAESALFARLNGGINNQPVDLKPDPVASVA